MCNLYLFHYRPSAHEVLSHCLFWSPSKQLSFFQDVSDRIEKESPVSPVVQSLERGSVTVIQGDWRDHISEELRQGTCDIIHIYIFIFKYIFLIFIQKIFVSSDLIKVPH